MHHPEAVVPAGRVRHWSVFGAIASAALVSAVVLLGLVLVGGLFPWRLTTVDTGSMSPHIPAGSLVLERTEPTSALHVGQVITYLPPGHTEELTHRVSWVGWDADHQAMFRTRGDANPGEDPWQAIAVAPDIWTMAAHVPALGEPVAFAREAIAQPAVLLLLVLIALLALWIRPNASRKQRLGSDAVTLPSGRRIGPLPMGAVQHRLRRGLTRRTSALVLIAATAVTGSVALQAVNADSAQAAWSARTSRGHAIKTVVLATPTNVTASSGCLLGASKVSLTWTSPPDGRTAIVVQRRTGTTGSWVPLPSLAPGATSYIDTGALAFATTYTYRVQHQTTTWSGSYSATASVNTLLQATCLLTPNL